MLIPGLTQGIQAWWQWTHNALALETDDIRTQNWVSTTLLPWIYWKQQSAKTRTPDLKKSYETAAERAYQTLIQHPTPKSCISKSGLIGDKRWPINISALLKRSEAAMVIYLGFIMPDGASRLKA